MKPLLTLLAILMTALCFGNDTLTVRDVYDFSVGDTFDYRHLDINYDFPKYEEKYYRKILIGKQLSANQDTIVYTFQKGQFTETLVVADLDSPAILPALIALDTSCNFVFSLDSTKYPNFLSNTVWQNCFEYSRGKRYTKKMGQTLTKETGIAQTTFSNWNVISDELVYYASGPVKVGKPYYLFVDIQETAKERVSVYPTVTADYLYLNTPCNHYEIFTGDGRMVLSNTTPHHSNAITVGMLANGMYLIRLIDTNEACTTLRFFIQH